MADKIEQPNKSIREYERRINKTLGFINENLDKEICLKDLADVSCFSIYHFHRIFTSLIGETPIDFINRLRIEKAASLLISIPSLSITEIYLQCGFSSSSAFAKSFKRYFNESATSWKTKYLNSKIGQAKSNIGQELLLNGNYVYDVNKLKEVEQMEIELKQMPAFHIGYLTYRKGYNSGIGELFNKLCLWAGPRNLLNKDTKFIGVSLDNPKVTDPEKCRYNACITIPGEIKEDNILNIGDIPSLYCAVYRYKGLQENLSEAYNNIFDKYLPQSNFEPAEHPAYEIYYGDPKDDPEGKFDLALCVPVKSLV